MGLAGINWGEWGIVGYWILGGGWELVDIKEGSRNE